MIKFLMFLCCLNFSLSSRANKQDTTVHFIINIVRNSSSTSTHEIKEKLTQKFSERGCKIGYSSRLKSWYNYFNPSAGHIDLIFIDDLNVKVMKWFSSRESTGAVFDDSDGTTLEIIDLMFAEDYRSLFKELKCE